MHSPVALLPPPVLLQPWHDFDEVAGLVAVIKLPAQDFVPGVAGHGGKNQQVKPASGDAVNGLIDCIGYLRDPV
jgi:hypothetical protein